MAANNQQTSTTGKFSLLAALAPPPREVPKYPDDPPQATPAYPDQDSRAAPKYPSQDEDSAESRTVVASVVTPQQTPVVATPSSAVAVATKQAPMQHMPQLALGEVPLPRQAPQADAPTSAPKQSPAQLALAQVPVPQIAPRYATHAPQAVAMLVPKPSVAAIARARRGDVGEGDTADDAKSSVKTGLWSVQIGAFADTASAKNRLADFASKSPDILAHAQKLVVPLRSPKGKLLYRARFGSFAEGDARETCVKMMERGQPCFAVAAR